MEDFEKQKLWMPGLVGYQKIDDKNFTMTFKQGSKEITHQGFTDIADKPNILKVRMRGKGFEGSATYKLKSLDKNQVELIVMNSTMGETLMFKIVMYIMSVFFWEVC